MTDVSIIAPCYNEEDFIILFLENVGRLDCFEFATVSLVIADGQSDDNTLDIVRSAMVNLNWRLQNGVSVRVVPNPARIVSSGLNTALVGIGDESIVVRMDIHTKYAADYLVRVAETLESTHADCVGGAWVAAGKNTKQKAIAAAFQSRLVSGYSKSRDVNYCGEVDTVYLGAWRAGELKRVSGFDESLIRNQDDELCARIRKNGGTIYQNKTIRSTYFPRASIQKTFIQYFQYGNWKFRSLVVSRSAPQARFLFLIFLAAILAFGLPLVVISSIPNWILVIPIFMYFAFITVALLSVSGLRKQRIAVFSLAFYAAAFAMHTGYILGVILSVIKSPNVPDDAADIQHSR